MLEKIGRSLRLLRFMSRQDWEMGGPDKDARYNDVFEVTLKRLFRWSDLGGAGSGWRGKLLEEGQRGGVEIGVS